ncbi:hypothetical protein J9305_18930 (plasmid) [Leptospira interrogans]|nr:hypothetical protein J9305_18930 [Leptospira interrogans]
MKLSVPDFGCVSRPLVLKNHIANGQNQKKMNSEFGRIFPKEILFLQSEYWTDSGMFVDLMLEGVVAPQLKVWDSIIWAGDSYDLVYILLGLYQSDKVWNQSF